MVNFMLCIFYQNEKEISDQKSKVTLPNLWQYIKKMESHFYIRYLPHDHAKFSCKEHKNAEWVILGAAAVQPQRSPEAMPKPGIHGEDKPQL